LAFVDKLRPISFDWKDGGMKDVGFGAEDVAKIDPLFVTYNQDGQVEGVKYDRLSAAFVNAFKEQQAQIESQQIQIKDQQEQLKRQQAEIEALKKVVCSQNSTAEMCKPKN
jgi:molecular chaperone GrpE (heat shock protein)